MKILLLPICLLFALNSSGSSSGHINERACANALVTKTIEDGWYSAIVKTGLSARYRLNVKVQYDRVVAIDFGNGGSVHAGFNNEGYIYSGGNLSVYGNDATTTVTVLNGSDLKYFYITLE